MESGILCGVLIPSVLLAVALRRGELGVWCCCRVGVPAVVHGVPARQPKSLAGGEGQLDANLRAEELEKKNDISTRIVGGSRAQLLTFKSCLKRFRR